MVGASVRLLVAATFLVASVGKLRARREFGRHISEVLGTSIATVLGPLVLLLECVLGALVLFDVGGIYPPFGMVLFVNGASAFLALQFVRTRSVECACFGRTAARPGDEESTSAWAPEDPNETSRRLVMPTAYAARNGALCGGAAYLTWSGDSAEGLTLLLASIGPALLIAIGLMGSIVRERRRLRWPQHPRYATLAPLLAPLSVLDYYKESTRFAAVRGPVTFRLATAPERDL